MRDSAKARFHEKAPVAGRFAARKPPFARKARPKKSPAEAGLFPHQEEVTLTIEHDQLDAAIFCTSFLRIVAGHRLGFAITLGTQTGSRHTLRSQVILH